MNHNLVKNIKVSWRCPSNIALVKYWGKRHFQLPENPSLSFSLKNSLTETSVEIIPGGTGKINFSFEGDTSSFSKRVEAFLDLLLPEISWGSKVDFYIESKNTFPHSAGIASSASAFGSLALCLADLNKQVNKTDQSLDGFQSVASRWARLGSGSASRSVYGGFSLWGRTNLFESATDEKAIQLNEVIHPDYKELKDTVLLVSSGEKPISSSEGHKLMETNPFRRSRIAQAHEHLNALYLALLTGDKKQFLEIAEAEALSLHAMMMTSNPPFILLKPNSLEIIQRIKFFRERTEIPVGYTIDAGPNIHLLYFLENKTEVQTFIKRELLNFCENRRYIDDGIGDGPMKIL
jgi:diphosphomevalonate decarboxylase